jgi:small subunit ribosomal protein S11
MAEDKQAQKKETEKKETPQKEAEVKASIKKSADNKKEQISKTEIKKDSTKKAIKETTPKTEEQEMKEAVESFKTEDNGPKVAKTESKNTSGKFIQKKKNRKIRRQVQKGQAYVNATYNNTIVTLSDLHGNVLAWSSAGYLGFKGAKKATTYAAAQVVVDVTEKVQKYGLKDLDVYVKGVGSGRESAIRTLAQKGFNLNLIKDRTPIPHNGCRPKKPRRV